MSSENNKRKISNFLINYSIQRRIIVINLIFMVLVMILTMSIIYTHLVESDLGITGIWHFALGDLSMSLSAKLIILYAILFITFLFSIITQLWMTHRVCGALVNFTNAFKKVSTGDFLERVNLRKDDLLKKEAGQFNDMISNLSELVNDLETENKRLNSALEDAADLAK